MSKRAWFVLGALVVLAAVVTGGSVILMGAHGFSARGQPSAVERWIARRAYSMAVPDNAKPLTNPTPDSPEALADARAHWADHCATCHANNGSGDSEMGTHLYPPAPDMRPADTQDMTDGELFYIIQNGVRLTGMPALGQRFGTRHPGFVEAGPLYPPSAETFGGGGTGNATDEPEDSG